MKTAILSAALLAIAASLAWPQDVPYTLRDTKPQDLGGLRANMQDLASRGRDDVGGAATVGDWCADSPTLCVDATNHRVGVSTSAPAVALDVNGAVSVAVGSVLTVSSITTNGGGEVYISTQVRATTFRLICPSGFTDIKLGCMETAEEGTGAYLTAQDDCFDTYEGRLPMLGEAYLAFANFALTNEADDYEWVGEVSEGTGNVTGTTLNGSTPSWDTYTNSTAYRCYIPR